MLTGNLGVVLGYLAFGFAWLLCFDLYLLYAGDLDPEALMLHLAEDAAYVVVSAFVIYLLLRFFGSRYFQERARRDAAEQGYRSLFVHNPSGVCLVDRAGRFLEANDAICELFGRAREDLLGRTWEPLVDPGELDAIREQFEAALVGEARFYEATIIRADGERRLLDVANVPRSEDGEVTGVYGVVRDITEERQAKERIAASEARHRAVFEHGMDGLLLLTSDGEILAANPAAQKIFRMTEAELKRRGRSGITDQSDPAVHRAIEERKRTGRSHAVLRMIRSDGERFIAEISAVQFESAEGEKLVSVAVRDITEQRERERRLDASEARFRALYEHSMDAILLSDPAKGRMLACNPAAEQLFGRSETELKTLHRDQVFDTGDPALADFIRQRDATGHARGVLRIYAAEGKPIPVEATTSVFHDEHGNRRSSVIMRDISEQLRREQALRESEDRFRALFEQSMDAIFITEPSGRIHDCNPAAEKLFGYSRKEILALGRAGLVDESEPAFQRLMEERRTSDRARAEIHMRRADGGWFLADLSVVGFKDINGEERTSVVVRDITEQRRQEELLQESEERFRAIFEHSSDAIFLVDPEDGKTLSANRAAEKLLGISQKELIGRTRDQDVLVEDPALEEFLAERKRKGRAQAVLRMRRADGTVFPAEVTSTVFTDRKGRQRATAIVRDVTERQQYEAALSASEERFRIVADHTGQAVYEIDLETGQMIWAGACEHMFGVDAEALARMPARERLEHVSEPQRDRVAQRYREVARSGGPYRFEYELHTADGRHIEVDDRGVVIPETHRMYGVIQDVTEHHRLVKRLEEQKATLSELSATQQAILDALPAHVALLDESGTVRFVNASWRRFAQQNELQGHQATLGGNYLSVCEQAAQDDEFAGRVARAIRDIIAGKQDIFDAEYACHGPEEQRWFRQVITPYRSGETRGAVVAHLDITDRVEAESQLELVAAAFRSADEALLICDSDFHIREVNEAYEQLIGISREQALGTRPGFLDIGNQGRAVRAGLEREGRWHGELLQRDLKGRVFTSRVSVMGMQAAASESEFLVISFEDISRLREIERRVDYLSYHDSLTGLPNRAALEQWFDEFTRANGDGHRLALAYLDLDSFKAVNESFGHSVGDELLVEVAERLKNAGQERDYVVRLGGDDFIVVLPDVQRRGEAVSRINALLHAVTEPIRLKQQKHYLMASAGISRYPDDSKTLEDLLRCADAAHAAAKQMGRGQIRLFSADLQEDVRQHAEIESHLRDAIRQGELSLNYQPSVRLADGRILGLEALVRWDSPKLGSVSPARFVSVAEKTGLIYELGDWVLNAACAQARQWLDAGLDFGRLAVNLSPMQFQYPELVPLVGEVLEKHGLEGRHLQFEITENVLMLDPDHTIRVLKELRELGIEIAIDDFGTGYSSMAYLRNFPVQFLKLDRAFVKELPDNATDASIAKTVINLARELDMKVIAEGIETQAQRDCLLEWGCHEAQGYYFSRPLPAKEATSLIERRLTLPTKA